MFGPRVTICCACQQKLSQNLPRAFKGFFIHRQDPYGKELCGQYLSSIDVRQAWHLMKLGEVPSNVMWSHEVPWNQMKCCEIMLYLEENKWHAIGSCKVPWDLWKSQHWNHKKSYGITWFPSTSFEHMLMSIKSKEISCKLVLISHCNKNHNR